LLRRRRWAHLDGRLQSRGAAERDEDPRSAGIDDDVRYFVTACPKDYVMYSDAVKTSGNEGKIEVKDLIELVAEALS
jgi:Fe-S oxidoreductase